MVVGGRGAADGAGVAPCTAGADVTPAAAGTAGADVTPAAAGTAGADVTADKLGGAEPATLSKLELLVGVVDGWGTRVMLDGTAVIMAGFTGTCFAQIPA